MKPVEVVESLRPEVRPLGLTERRMIRERLFGVGHGDISGSITRRSSSGAVEATAPHGARITPNSARRRPGSTTGGSWAKVVAGLVLVGGLAALGWAFLARDDAESEAIPTTTETTTTTSTTTTTTTTTLPPAVRTGVTPAEPIVIPGEALIATEAVVLAPAAGSSSVLFRAPDGTNVWMTELDGDPADFGDLQVETIGAVQVGTPSDEEGGGAPTYQIRTPCGFTLLIDAPGQTLYRPALTALLESMSIDAAGAIDVLLPEGWSIVDVGPNQNRVVSAFELPVFGEVLVVRLDQIPGGTFADLTFGNRQLQQTTFAGEPAFLDSQPFPDDLTSVYWRDADTVFHLRAEGAAFEALEDFVALLEPATVDEFLTRFDAVPPPEPTVESSCAPQPRLGPTLDP